MLYDNGRAVDFKLYTIVGDNQSFLPRKGIKFLTHIEGYLGSPSD